MCFECVLRMRGMPCDSLSAPTKGGDDNGRGGDVFTWGNCMWLVGLLLAGIVGSVCTVLALEAQREGWTAVATKMGMGMEVEMLARHLPSCSLERECPWYGVRPRLSDGRPATPLFDAPRRLLLLPRARASPALRHGCAARFQHPALLVCDGALSRPMAAALRERVHAQASMTRHGTVTLTCHRDDQVRFA